MSDDINILALTAHRPEKTIDPLESSGYGKGIELDNSKSFVGKYVDLCCSVFKEVRTNEYDAIVVNGTNLIGMVGLAVGLFTETPVIVRLGGDIWERHRKEINGNINPLNARRLVKYALRSIVTWIVLRLAAGVITVSHDLKRRTIEEMDCQEGNVRVIHSPIKHQALVSPDTGTVSKEFDESQTVLLTVTNLKFPAKYRGVMDTIDAVSPLLRKRDDLVYVVAGGGKYLPKVKQHVKELGLEQVHILGYVEDVEPVYSAADIFVYVSYNDGYPNVVLEAGAAGLPRIANEEGGIPEQINDGRDGILVDLETNPRALREAVQTLLDDPQRASSFGEAAQRTVTSYNDDSEVGKRMEQAVKEIVNSGK